MRDFDKEAATWDTPPRVKLAEDVARTIAQHIPLKPDMDVMDFGCGTGLLSLALRPQVRSVTGVDSSSGMLAVLKEKIARGRVTGVKAVHLDLDKGEALTGSYHLIVTSMAMHHIQDVKGLLSKFYETLLPGGYLAVADLEPEGGLFHDNHAGVFHHGFERGALRRNFSETGLEDIHDCSATEMQKPIADGSMCRFRIFLMSARKKD